MIVQGESLRHDLRSEPVRRRSMLSGRQFRVATPPAPAADRTPPALDAKANSQLRMLWIVCGTADRLIGVNRQFKDWLKSQGVQFTEQEVPDMGHVWPLWRQNLTDMVPKLFQPKRK